jgi:hypothetical protein
MEEALEDLDGRVRMRPYFDVLIDLFATNNMKVNPTQAEIFKEADHLIGAIEKKGGRDAITASDLGQLESLHRRFIEHYPDLVERRQKVLDEWGGKVPDAARGGIRSDVEKADSGHNY